LPFDRSLAPVGRTIYRMDVDPGPAYSTHEQRRGSDAHPVATKAGVLFATGGLGPCAEGSKVTYPDRWRTPGMSSVLRPRSGDRDAGLCPQGCV